MQKIVFLLLGALFGFVLSRAGATTYDFYAKLFLFEDFQLMWVIMSAAGVGVIGLGIIKRLRPNSILGRQPISLQGKPYKKTLIPGSLIFGYGLGSCRRLPGNCVSYAW